MHPGSGVLTALAPEVTSSSELQSLTCWPGLGLCGGLRVPRVSSSSASFSSRLRVASPAEGSHWPLPLYFRVPTSSLGVEVNGDGGVLCFTPREISKCSRKDVDVMRGSEVLGWYLLGLRKLSVRGALDAGVHQESSEPERQPCRGCDWYCGLGELVLMGAGGGWAATKAR